MFVQQSDFSFPYLHHPKTEKSFHHHLCFELVYYIHGSGMTTIDGSPYNYSDNTFTFIQPRASHNEVHFEETQLFCIGFSFSVNDSIKIKNGLYYDRSFTLLHIVKQMVQEWNFKRIHYSVKLLLLLNEFLIEFERMQSLPAVSPSFAHIENYIHANFNQEIDLPSLAKMSGYSYDHFRHLFKLNTGDSPLSYIIHKRIEHAKKLILSTDMTMSMISQECGFSNSSQFASAFRKLTGLTPSLFKRKNIFR